MSAQPFAPALAAALLAAALFAQAQPAADTAAPAAPERTRESAPAALARFVVPAARLDAGSEQELRRLLARQERTTREAGQDAEDDEGQLRRLRAAALELLATEGYFAASVEVAVDRDRAARFLLNVEPGARSEVREVTLDFEGPLRAQTERVAALRAAWKLPVGAPFRDPVWSEAKSALLAAVQARNFPTARLLASEAQVDVAAGAAALRVTVDSGPAFTLGEIEVKGLRRYSRRLVDRYWTEAVGAPYDAARLLELQRRLQAADAFATATVDVPLDPAHPERVPILVEVVEAQTRRLELAGGYSTNTGVRAEGTWRQAQVLELPYTLFAGFGLDRTRTLGFADLLLPPKPDGALDSVGTLAERTDVEGLRTQRWAVGVRRDRERSTDAATYVTQLAATYQSETRRFLAQSALQQQQNDVVAATYSWTRRAVDSVTDPRRGHVVALTGSVGLRNFGARDLVGQTFVRAAGRGVQYIPLTAVDQLILRIEGGHVFTDNPQFVPNEFLFRTGGATTVRGYGYQSLGRKEGSVTLGSPSLLVLGAEYVRWLAPQWGAAAFVDAGDASDRLWAQPLAVGVGAGARWKTVAGPIALDLAYGERERRWRLHFSIAVAF